MSTIKVIQSTDLITDSRADLNDNFAALNADKIETSVLDTDTTLAADSDSKVPTQKAVKAYVDAGGNVNASETARGIVELATSDEIDAGTATGATGAALVVTAEALKGSLAPIVRKYLTADSPATWTKPAGLKYVVVEVQGAGGKGASTGGGGGGGYSKKLIATASLGTTETVTIGAGSVGTGNTSFGAHAIGGNGANASNDTGGAGGTASGGDININGQTGANGQSSNGGGSGGGSVLGMGGLFRNSENTVIATSGLAGAGYGGGGSGNADASDGSPDATGDGGAGAPGIVIVTEYYV